MKKLLPFVVALTLVAVTSFAGDCHIANVVPIVNEWSITGTPGGLVVDAKIAPRVAGAHPGDDYDPNSDDGHWWHSLYLRPVGETGFYTPIDCLGATVTDSTFHFETTYPAGAYDYIADIGGTNGDPQECAFPYTFTGTVVVVDPTPAKRASWGSVRVLWR